VNLPYQGGGTFPFTIDGDQLLTDAASLSDLDSGAPTLMPGWMDIAAKGDIAGFYTAFLGGPLTPPTPNDPVLSEGKTGVSRCHDYIAFEPDSELQVAAHELPEYRVALLTLRFIYVPTETKQACEVWRVGRAKRDQHMPVTSAIPTLVLTAEWDGIVSPLHDEKIASTLSNSFFQNGFSLHRDTACSSHRQRCNNRGSSEWSSYTSSRLTDSVRIPLRGQYGDGPDAPPSGSDCHLGGIAVFVVVR